MDIYTMDIFDVSTNIMDVFSFLLIVHIERCHHFLSSLILGHLSFASFWATGAVLKHPQVFL